MDQNVHQIAGDRVALELGRLMVSKILLEAQLESLHPPEAAIPEAGGSEGEERREVASGSEC